MVNVEEFYGLVGIEPWLRGAHAAGLRCKRTDWGSNQYERDVVACQGKLYLITTKKIEGKWRSCAVPLAQNSVHPATINVKVSLKSSTKEAVKQWFAQLKQLKIDKNLLNFDSKQSGEVLGTFRWGSSTFQLVRQNDVVFARPK